MNSFGWMAWEAWLRGASFVALFVLFATLESVWPRRRGALRRGLRWSSNAALLVADRVALLLLGLLLPALSTVAVAVWAQDRAWGLLPWLALPGFVSAVLGLALMDLAIYAQHRAFHRLAWLWPLHRVHHSDTCLDVSSGIRFHPLEILLSAAIRALVVLALGVSPELVIGFEIALNGTALFNHANLRIPASGERWLRHWVVTPDLHRVHHSVLREETDSNFGFCLSLWDRLLGTFRAQPKAGHEGMTIGLEEFRSDPQQGPLALLAQPFRTPGR